MARARSTSSRRTTRPPSRATSSQRSAPARSSASGTRRGRGAGQDALSLLAADHKHVAKLLRQFERADDGGSDRREIAEQICRELEMHATVEEEIFYPAAREAIRETDLIDEAAAEHDTLKRLVADIRSGGDRSLFAATVKVLGEYVKHHVGEEENEIFPQAKRAKLDLEDLGRRIAERKAELQGEPASRRAVPVERTLETGNRSATDRLVGGGMLRH